MAEDKPEHKSDGSGTEPTAHEEDSKGEEVDKPEDNEGGEGRDRLQFSHSAKLPSGLWITQTQP